jgi:hypothetical protein
VICKGKLKTYVTLTCKSGGRTWKGRNDTGSKVKLTSRQTLPHTINAVLDLPMAFLVVAASAAKGQQLAALLLETA